ncbi:LacI family DNA-binding transcriptional regulator [Dactylosporangium sucinum]|uniref:LacI family transcriptional regulator n=1 Tax=Dactylosporangium sucinum TaxID=1424081 RepID=A0A917TUF1_9ACTN|nr:LacI family DNA-binding transcriptional regulator [Dactylosporangium sucinum]GGM37944.1 LacI family transcriptional regulator [Dactylosporangium sucinum]
MNRSKPTIEDVARVAGVSRATVSRVINNVPGASEPLRARVHEAVTALGYLPNQTARALASGRPRALDLVAVKFTPESGWLGTDPYYSRVLAGVLSVLEGQDVHLRLHAVGSGEAIDAIAADATVGAVLTNVPPDLAARFHRRCRRVVSVVATAPAVPAVEADNVGGAQAAVEHLYRLGRRRVAAIHGPDATTCAADRRAGYERAVRTLGLDDLGIPGGEFLREDGHAAARRLLARHPDVDAVFVACDVMAAGAVQALTETGRRVPQDVSVVGFDDSLAAVCSNPPLTTMRVPVEEMAAEATRLLLNEGTLPVGYRERFPVTLVQRSS